MRRLGFLISLMLISALLLWATTTNFSEPYASAHGWTYTQLSCAGTCSSGDVSGDGNPLPSVFAKVADRNKLMTGYWEKAFTWEAMGVPSGEDVSTVDGQWDNFTIQTAVACTTAAVVGMQIFDSADTTEATASAVEPNIDVSGDTSVWVNHDPTGAIAVNAGQQASTTTVTLRFNLHPRSGNNASAACEIRGDNYALSIESAAAGGAVPKRRTITYSRLKLPRMQ